MKRKGLAAQLKPHKLGDVEIYLLIEQGKYVGRTTSTKNALHFATLTEKGKSKVIVQLCNDEVLVTMSAANLRDKLIAEHHSAELEKKQAAARKKAGTSVPASKYGVFA